MTWVLGFTYTNLDENITAPTQLFYQGERLATYPQAAELGSKANNEYQIEPGNIVCVYNNINDYRQLRLNPIETVIERGKDYYRFKLAGSHNTVYSLFKLDGEFQLDGVFT